MIHPIEAESYRILEGRVDLSHLGPRSRAVVERVIHASADPEYATTMCVGDDAVEAGVRAVRAGAPVLCDVEMVRHGVHGIETECHLPATGDDPDTTRAALGMRAAAARHPAGAIVVVGCAPTALDEVVDVAEQGAFAPALVIGLPVGFVGAAESKARLRASGLPAISNAGEKGGSAVAAAAVNVLVRLAADAPEGNES
ncbi:MAG TPA: precorrin-8X methylmutase [Acidimicrobiia bacterium]|nr:precorrin-8X methylmutase [Acidimicrobiia bacterium]